MLGALLANAEGGASAAQLGTVTDAALAAVRSCTGATDLLVKSKLGLDETVLPPMLRVLAYALLPALKRALTDVAGRLDGIEVVALGREALLACEEAELRRDLLARVA